MNNKGVTIVELLIVIVVMGIIASIGTVSVNGVVTNIRQKGFVASAEVIRNAGKRAYSEEQGIWVDDKISLRELITYEYIEPLKSDPWGGAYDLDASYVIAIPVVAENQHQSSPYMFLTNVQAAESVTFKVKIITSNVILGYEEELEVFTKDDIVYLNSDNDSIFEKIIESITGNFNSTLQTDDGDDTVNITGKLTNRGVIETYGGNDSVTIGKVVKDNAYISTGDGDDSVTINQMLKNRAKVDTGAGDDTVYIKSQFRDNAKILTGSGDDTVTITGKVSVKAIINTGDGNDTVTLSILDTRYKGSIYLGAGTDTLNLPNVTLAVWNAKFSSNVYGAETINLKDAVINQ